MTSPAATGARSSPRGGDWGDGWRVVGATFVSTFTVFGVAYSFGSFFGPMADEFGSGRGSTALVFSITTFLYFVLGMVTGRVADHIGPRPVLLFGAVCMVLGLVATSRVDSLVVGYVTYGIGVGIGVACAYVPMVAAVGGWFERQRTTALGVAVAGIGVGTLVGAPLTERLVEAQGWRHTYVVLAVGCAGLFTVAVFGADRPPQLAGTQPPPLWNTVRASRPFWFLYLSIVLLSSALFVPFVFLADYVAEEEIDGSAGWLVGLIGMSSVVGRIGLGALAAHRSALQLYRASYGVLGVSFLIWLAAGQNYQLLVVFAVVLGVAYGGFIALSPAVAAQIFGPAGLGGLLGALYTGAGVGGLIGPPVMGAVIDRLGYDAALVSATALGLSAAVALLWVSDDAPDVAPSGQDRNR